MSPRSRAGVTFMEVSIALVMVVFVAAVLFPVLQMHREEGSRPPCALNMKELSLALTQYVQDSDNNFPSGTNTAGSGWAGKLYPFIKSAGVYYCPHDSHNGSYVSYAENQNLVKQPLTNLAVPAATVELYEATTAQLRPRHLGNQQRDRTERAAGQQEA